ncbi:hypothetical protein TNCV_910821 [Trichonephila clavipes]|uniref:Uncharacterized protein n=1 Tax=Trichonephila clavipes TaxID=2585209 RepID=A0A8X7BDA2_TRICX|nr:hypothetical protein TNCV_910821 [Trichonephila clavipes]
MASNSRPACHEFEPSATEDPPRRDANDVKSFVAEVLSSAWFDSSESSQLRCCTRHLTVKRTSRNSLADATRNKGKNFQVADGLQKDPHTAAAEESKNFRDGARRHAETFRLQQRWKKTLLDDKGSTQKSLHYLNKNKKNPHHVYNGASSVFSQATLTAHSNCKRGQAVPNNRFNWKQTVPAILLNWKRTETDKRLQQGELVRAPHLHQGESIRAPHLQQGESIRAPIYNRENQYEPHIYNRENQYEPHIYNREN